MSGAQVGAGAGGLVGKKLGRYEVLAQLAQGGMATVYVGRAQAVAGFERLVAIKVLHPHIAHDEEFISMFLDEARLAARIHHPNVVSTIDISDSDGEGYFLVMDYVQGDHVGALLRELSKAGARLPAPVAIRIVVDALEGLGAAHNLRDHDGKLLGIVHRDVSPHNILVGVDGVSRITDFGVAKAEVRLSTTRDGLMKGKLAYMSPEQASTGQADARSDVFGLGVVAWEAFTGRRLFRADTNADLLRRIMYDPIPRASMYEPDLAPVDAVLSKALARKPEARFQSCAEFVEALEAIAPQLGGVASPRQVGKLVKHWAHTKLDLDSAAIAKTLEGIGAPPLSWVAPRPAESSIPAIPVPNIHPSMTPSAVRPVHTTLLDGPASGRIDITHERLQTSRSAEDERRSRREADAPVLVTGAAPWIEAERKKSPWSLVLSALALFAIGVLVSYFLGAFFLAEEAQTTTRPSRVPSTNQHRGQQHPAQEPPAAPREGNTALVPHADVPATDASLPPSIEVQQPTPPVVARPAEVRNVAVVPEEAPRVVRNRDAAVVVRPEQRGTEAVVAPSERLPPSEPQAATANEDPVIPNPYQQ